MLGLTHSHRALCTSVTIAWTSYGPWEKKQASFPLFPIQQHILHPPGTFCCPAPRGISSLSEFQGQVRTEARQSCPQAGPEGSRRFTPAAGFSAVLLKDCKDECPQRSPSPSPFSPAVTSTRLLLNPYPHHGITAP